ncbi:MAG: YjgP/YjgQ family permease [bacterium]|jgi:lipopolysaccharide export system permease protein
MLVQDAAMNNEPKNDPGHIERTEELSEATPRDGEARPGSGSAESTQPSEEEARIEEAIIRGEMAGVERRRKAAARVLPEAKRKKFPAHFGKLADLYVFSEAFTWWFLGFSLFLAFLIVNQIVLEGENLLNPKIPTAAVLRLVYYNIPWHITMALPVATLVGVLLSMGRMAKDNELTALFTNGISLYRMIFPIFTLAAINAGIMYYVSDSLTAPAFREQEKIKEMYPALREEDEIQKKEPTIVRLPDGRYFTARTLDKATGQALDVIIDGMGLEEGEYAGIIWVANIGRIEGKNITLSQPKKYILDPEGQLMAMERPPTARLDLGLELHRIVSTIRTPEQLTKVELKMQQEIKKELGTNTDRDQTDYWLKFSAPFAPIAFALVAMPLSLRAPRDERFLGIIFALLLMMFYYVLYFIFKTVGYNGAIAPWLAAWMQNIVFAVLAFGIFVTSRK